MPMTTNVYPHIPEVLEEHAEECAFVWQQRDAALFAPDFDLPDLLEWDNRLDAHVEGLTIGGARGLEAALELELIYPGEWFVQARLLLTQGKLTALIELLSDSVLDPLYVKACRSALGFAETSELKGVVQRLLSSDESLNQAAGITGCALHRVNPGPVLQDALTSTDALLAARAIKCAGEIGLIDYQDIIKTRLTDPDIAVRFHAARALAVLGSSVGMPTLRDIASSDGRYQREAMMLYIAVIDPQEVSAWLAQLSENETTARLAMIGAGLTGDPKYLPALLDRMRIPELARVAGEAFEWITGLYIYEASLEVLNQVELPSRENLEAMSMRADQGEDDAEGDWEDEADDDDAGIHPEDVNLVVPDIEKMLPWWDQNKHRFETNTRYFCGMPVGPEADAQLIRVGRQRYRHQAAFNLALRNPGQPLFDVRAPARRQWRQLSNA